MVGIFVFANGNMTKDYNKGIDSIYYNHLNLPYIVDMDNPGDSIVYEYDAAGIKLKQRVYQSDTLFKTTDYAGEFIYENGDLQFIQHEEGRLTPLPGGAGGGFDYQYHLKDHLGNTRSTFTTGVYTSGYLATFEDATYAQDTTDFFNVDPRVTYPPGGKAVRLNSSSAIGPGFASAVSRGDTIAMSVKAYYASGTYGTNPVPASTISALLASTFGVNGGSVEVQQLVYDLFNAPAQSILDAVVSGDNLDNTRPAAYLNYLLFDTDFTLQDHGHFGIEDGADLEQTISVNNLIINQAGFIYIYLSNESNSSNYVFFDNLDVAISESPVLETTDYYPFGLAFNSYSKAGMIDQRFKYNGKEKIDALGLEWYDYQARYYDPALGRWHVIDPAANLYYNFSPYNYVLNSPTKNIDPDGRVVGTLIGTIVGGVAGAYEAHQSGGDVWAGAAEGAVAGAITGAAVDLAVGATIATGGGAAVVILAGAAAGAAGGAVGAVAGDATGQVVTSVNEGDDLGTAVGNISTENMADKATTGAVTGAIGGAAGGAVGKGLQALTKSTKAVQGAMSKNITTTSKTLNSMEASSKTIQGAQYKITQGMAKAGKATVEADRVVDAAASTAVSTSTAIKTVNNELDRQ